jgi:pyrimidine operon attenuation protein/uracil phosphoribosyltransferase
LASDPAASGAPTAPGRDDAPGSPGSPGPAGDGGRPGGGNGPGNGSGRILLDERGIDRSLMRIAHEMIERTDEPERLYLVAIPNGGIPLARRLAANLRQIADLVVPVGILDTTLYRDDLLSSGERPPLRRTEMPSAVDDHVVILVDDVVKTGRTIRAAMDALMDFGRPRAVQVVGLVDRGHRELPIKLDYVGKNVPTQPHEQVSLRQAVDGGRETLELVILGGAGGTDEAQAPAGEGGDA